MGRYGRAAPSRWLGRCVCNRELEERLISLRPDTRAAAARNEAKRSAFAQQIAAYPVKLDANPDELADWREAMLPWTRYEPAKAQPRRRYVDCRVSGCVLASWRPGQRRLACGVAATAALRVRLDHAPGPNGPLQTDRRNPLR